MCTRYFRTEKSDEHLTSWAVVDPVMRMKLEENRGEVRPTDFAPVVCISQRGTLFLQWQKWGFIDDSMEGWMVLNARAEGVLENRMFMHCMENGRCLIPAAGFYEWNARKERYVFTPNRAKNLWMAGLYRWSEDTYQFVVLTTAANESMGGIHDRMPLILGEREAVHWLIDPKKAKRLLRKVPAKLCREAEYEQQVLPFLMESSTGQKSNTSM